MSHSDTIPLHASSQSDIDEIENLINASVQSGPTTVLPARPPSPPRASIPVSSAPFIPSNLPPPPTPKPTPVPAAPPPPPPGSTGFGSAPNTLTEPVWDTVKRDLSRIVSNLKLVVFPNPFREDPGKALRDWDLWGPFFFIVFLGLTLSWSASVKKKMASSSRGLLTLFPDLNESTREITGAVALEPQPSAPEFAPLNFPMRSVEQRMAVQSDVEANQYTLKSCVETMTADARAEISVLKAENKELKRKATVMFRFGGPPYAAVEEQGVVIMPSGVGNTEATPARAAQDGGKKKRPAAE
ncbi:hypothetical protein HYC85_007673 [Camellia sinensis]|uniref:Uncharacterized protein n=1 Tax=Camellia sinensis TaxID=4442 RepID=A0A7J7HQX8_CAMSI|nr:hypothetical protein HYC85_007673 [Camellia sinensis]